MRCGRPADRDLFGWRGLAGEPIEPLAAWGRCGTPGQLWAGLGSERGPREAGAGQPGCTGLWRSRAAALVIALCAGLVSCGTAVAGGGVGDFGEHLGAAEAESPGSPHDLVT